MRWAALVAAAALLAGALWFLGGRGLFGFGPPGPEGDFAPSGSHGPLRPGEPLRILIVGTSATRKGSWTRELEELLKPCRPDGLVVEQVARVGASSAWGEPALRERLAGGPAPDIVVIEYSGNDSRLYRGMSQRESEARHRRMLEMARGAGAVPFLATMGSVIGLERLERPFLPAWHGWYRRFAREERVGLIDTSPGFWALSAAEARAALPDGSHMTPAAARVFIVPSFRRALSPLVCEITLAN